MSLFAPSSFWYHRIPDATPLHANSAGFVLDFLRQKNAFYGNVGINTTSYSSPVFVAQSDAPRVQVTQWNATNKPGFGDEGLARMWAQVPIPSFAVPADGTDAEMTVWQPSTETLWEFWKARKINGNWQASWGGRLQQIARSDGIWPLYYGTTATGLPFLGGQITAEELATDSINHVMGIALVQCAHWNVLSWPAKRGDGDNPLGDTNRIPQGTRFRLDPEVNIYALPLHPVARTIARAAQKYGFVVWDKGGAIGLRFQNPKSYTALGLLDPYVPIFNKTPTYALLNNFPWDRLQFLPRDYGMPT